MQSLSSKSSHGNSSFSFSFSKPDTNGKIITRTYESGCAHQNINGDDSYYKLHSNGKYIPTDNHTYHDILHQHAKLKTTMPTGISWFDSESCPIDELITEQTKKSLLESLIEVQKENNELRTKFFKNRDKKRLCEKCFDEC